MEGDGQRESECLSKSDKASIIGVDSIVDESATGIIAFKFIYKASADSAMCDYNCLIPIPAP